MKQEMLQQLISTKVIIIAEIRKFCLYLFLVISNVDQAKEGGINFGKVVPLIKSKTEGSEETDFKENIPAPQGN